MLRSGFVSLSRAPLSRTLWRAYTAAPVDQPRGASSPSSSQALSNLEINRITKRPIPLNVELTAHAPIKLPVKYGDLVADVTVSSFMGTKDLEFFSDFLLRVAFYLGIPARGPTPLPRKTKRWTVIKSPFVHAKSKENFERVTYQRQIKLYDANPDNVQIFLAVASKHSMPGVGVKAKTFTSESLDSVEAMDVGTQADAENPLAINKVDLESPGGDVAKAVLEILKDPRFATDPKLQAQVAEQLDGSEASTNTKQ